MKRRNLFAAVAVAGLIQPGLADAQASGRKKTFVLVHGAWHGGWCWSRVAERLRAAGHNVYTPTLSGLGERRHLISPQINLDTHITDVTNTILFEELSDVILVGHSYGGIIITGAADRLPAGRLRQLIYLDSLMLESGKSIFSSFPKDVVDARLKVIRETGGGVGAVSPNSAAAFGVKDTADGDWVTRNLTPQPVGTYLQPLMLNAPTGNGLPKTYIECTVDPIATLEPTKARIRTDAAWKTRTLATGHDAMVTVPGPLSDMLMDIAS